ncbi:MAG: Gfo/Idh/MocA family oxidoreductase [Gemmatimonadales bacterium]
MLNVGLVGFAGKVLHAPDNRAVEGLRLTTIVQRSGAPDPRYPYLDFPSTVDELRPRVMDLVVIATPNTSHHPIATRCLLAGDHVVIDKPFTTTWRRPQTSERPASSLGERTGAWPETYAARRFRTRRMRWRAPQW